MAKVKFGGSVVTMESVKTATGSENFKYHCPKDLEEALEVDGEERVQAYYERGRKLAWGVQAKAAWIEELVRRYNADPSRFAAPPRDEDDEIEENEK